jgi:hypothetical protein
MMFYEVLMGFCSILCFASAWCCAIHFSWMYKEKKATLKEWLFYWGVIVCPQVILSIYFLYNYLKS